VLKDEEHLGVAVVEIGVHHSRGDGVDAVSEPGLGVDVPAGRDGAHAGDKRTSALRMSDELAAGTPCDIISLIVASRRRIPCP
jgi:hypothetical protein